MSKRRRIRLTSSAVSLSYHGLPRISPHSLAQRFRFGSLRGHAKPCGAKVCIGETGFEPATARPPAECATRLRHSPWGLHSDGSGERMPMGTSVRLDKLCLCFDARGARGKSLMKTSPGGGEPAASAIPTAGLAGPRTSRSTTPQIKLATSPVLVSARKRWSKSGPNTWSPSCESTPVSTAGRRTPWCWSSTICGTRNFRSQRVYKGGAGRTCSTRLQSARSFVQTVIDAAPHDGVASSVRR